MLCLTDIPYMGGVKRIATPITRERRMVDNTYRTYQEVDV